MISYTVSSVLRSNRLSDHKNYSISRLFEANIRVVMAGSLRESASNRLSEHKLPLLAAILSTSKRVYTLEVTDNYPLILSQK